MLGLSWTFNNRELLRKELDLEFPLLHNCQKPMSPNVEGLATPMLSDQNWMKNKLKA